MGQSFLAIGALALFMFVALNVNRSYVTATTMTVEQQLNLDAVNYAQSLSEFVFSFVSENDHTDYDSLDVRLGIWNDITDPSHRLFKVTSLGDSLFATTTLGPEKEMVHGVNGRLVHIRVHARIDGVMTRLAENYVALMEPYE